MATITRVRVPTYVDVFVDGTPVTLYPIEVMVASGAVRRVNKRYSDVLNFHKDVMTGAPHPALEAFNFPHKSVFHTTAEFTKERRRSGFEEYFELLLRLGPEYAPFVATFLKDADSDGASSFDELGTESGSTPLGASGESDASSARKKKRSVSSSSPRFERQRRDAPRGGVPASVSGTALSEAEAETETEAASASDTPGTNDAVSAGGSSSRGTAFGVPGPGPGNAGENETNLTVFDGVVENGHFSSSSSSPENTERDALALARPASPWHWVAHFYVPVAGAALAYVKLLTLLGCLRPTDWTSGAAWLAVATSPLVLTVAFALLAPLCDQPCVDAK